MKYTKVPSDVFKKLQLNAGVLLADFDPTDGSVDETDILGATGGGTAFEAVPTFTDFGEDIDNVPNNTMELKRLDQWDVKMSGTFKSADTDLAHKLVGAADVSSNQITPRADLLLTDFIDSIWWVGDYSDVNADGTGTGAAKAGFMAIELKNALSTGGFKIQSNDNGKGDFAFEFTGHYSIEAMDEVPFDVYVVAGTPAS